jgi:coenzyme F420-dependent glucose-6-phosphate dehydrogenase
VPLLESVRGVLWARRRRPKRAAYWIALAHERFGPAELLRQAIDAETAGFDGVCGSDHLAPWWEPPAEGPAACGNLWVWLGAAGQATTRVALGSAVTGIVHRYNPVVVAQQAATLESLFPGRAFLGVGSGEAMNEVPAGMDWPGTAEQLARTEEALTIVTRLLDGDTVDFHGEFFRARQARLYLQAARRPPVYLSAFHEQAAELAGRLADGVWTLADPTTVPGIVAAYRRGAEAAGREPGEIILQTVASWAPEEDDALAAARVWKGTLVDEAYTDALVEPAEVRERGEQEIGDRQLRRNILVSSDPDKHLAKLRLIQGLGATKVVVMNVSADPGAMIRVYGERVLPALRSGARHG